MWTSKLININGQDMFFGNHLFVLGGGVESVELVILRKNDEFICLRSVVVVVVVAVVDLDPRSTTKNRWNPFAQR